MPLEPGSPEWMQKRIEHLEKSLQWTEREKLESEAHRRKLHIQNKRLAQRIAELESQIDQMNQGAISA